MLTQSPRSIDRNQQWQPYGIPYARTGGAAEPADPEKRRHGWDPSDAAGGLRLFIDPALRREVFLTIFPAPIAGELGGAARVATRSVRVRVLRGQSLPGHLGAR